MRIGWADGRCRHLQPLRPACHEDFRRLSQTAARYGRRTKAKFRDNPKLLAYRGDVRLLAENSAFVSDSTAVKLGSGYDYAPRAICLAIQYRTRQSLNLRPILLKYRQKDLRAAVLHFQPCSDQECCFGNRARPCTIGTADLEVHKITVNDRHLLAPIATLPKRLGKLRVPFKGRVHKYRDMAFRFNDDVWV